MTAYLLLSSTAILAALWLDRMLGETRCFHPLVGFGVWAKFLERQLYPNSRSIFTLWAMGVVAWQLAVMPVVIVSAIVTQLIVLSWGTVIYWLLSVVVIYIAIGARSLKEHALHISTPLQQGDLISARQALSMLVSRDTHILTEPEIATATIESVIENSHDSVIGVFFWYLVFGIPGVVLFRLANTLDAMWGYRNDRFNYFGRWAARIDDMLGYVSARVTVLLFFLQQPRSLAAAWHYGRRWYSPNAGPVMAAGAGALAIQLGGDQCYNGKLKKRPILGAGEQPCGADIGSALLLVERSYYLLPLLLLAVSILGRFVQ